VAVRAGDVLGMFPEQLTAPACRRSFAGVAARSVVAKLELPLPARWCACCIGGAGQALSSSAR
jgi:hypothetical protein